MQKSTLAATDPPTNRVTRDAFLGGKLHILQPRHGFRSGIDAVLLAASVPAAAGERVLELGCGVGVASLCLHARVDGLSLVGVELQADYAALAESNAASNKADLQVVTTDLRTLPDWLRQEQFAQVMMNPPYYNRTKGSAAGDDGRDLALAGDTPLLDWLNTGLKRLAPKGTLTLIQHITRLPEVLVALEGRLGSLVVRPIAGRAGLPPKLFLLQGRHSGRAAFTMRPTLFTHAGVTHPGDTEHYTPELQAILRDGVAFAIAD